MVYCDLAGTLRQCLFRADRPEELLIPTNAESVMFSAAPGFPLGQFASPTFLLNSGEDALIININLSLSMAFDSQPPTADNPHPQLRRAFETNDAAVVWDSFSKLAT